MSCTTSYTTIIKYINNYSVKKYNYGQVDNFLFVLGLIACVHKQDLLENFVNKYDNPNDLCKILYNEIKSRDSNVMSNNKHQSLINKSTLSTWRTIFCYLRYLLGCDNKKYPQQMKTGDIVWLLHDHDSTDFHHWQKIYEQLDLPKSSLSCQTDLSQKISNQKNEHNVSKKLPKIYDLYHVINDDKKIDSTESVVQKNYSFAYLHYHRCYLQDPLVCLGIMCDTELAVFTTQGMMFLPPFWLNYYFWSNRTQLIA